MGIYIKGVEMPTDHSLWIVVHSDGTVEANDINGNCQFGWQALQNAAIQVPPHGRLKDVDALNYTMLYKENWLNGTGVEAPAVWKKDIEDAPTIIEAEEGKQ